MKTNLEDLEVLHELKRFLNELELGPVDKLYIEGSCDILEKALTTLNLFKHAITSEHLPYQSEPMYETKEDGSVSVSYTSVINFAAHAIDAEAKKVLTNWVIDNIDKEQVRAWLDK